MRPSGRSQVPVAPPPLDLSLFRKALTRNARTMVSRARSSLNYLVSTGQERGCNVETECLGGLQVNHQLELRRRFNRKVRRLGPAQKAVYVSGNPPVLLHEVNPVSHQPAVLDKQRGGRTPARARSHWARECRIAAAEAVAAFILSASEPPSLGPTTTEWLVTVLSAAQPRTAAAIVHTIESEGYQLSEDLAAFTKRAGRALPVPRAGRQRLDCPSDGCSLPGE
jgi:hypothetical protein